MTFDEIKAANAHAASVCEKYGHEHGVDLSRLLINAYCAGHHAAQPKADERGSAEPRRKCECEKLPHETHCSWEWPNNPEPGLREALEEVVGCFEAEEVEGLPEALQAWEACAKAVLAARASAGRTE
jgi:hypothetical protein